MYKACVYKVSHLVKEEKERERETSADKWLGVKSPESTM